MSKQYSRRNSTGNQHRRLLGSMSATAAHNDTYWADHDKISVSSMSMAFDEKPNKDQMSNGEGPPPSRMHRSQSTFLRNWKETSDVPYIIGANITNDNHGICGEILFFLSWFLIVIFFPMSLVASIKVVQEYEYVKCVVL
jgi:hypothetical protein